MSRAKRDRDGIHLQLVRRALVLELNDARRCENDRPKSRTQQYSGQGPPTGVSPVLWGLHKLLALVARKESSLLIAPGTLTRKGYNRTGHVAILVHPECDVDPLFG